MQLLCNGDNRCSIHMSPGDFRRNSLAEMILVKLMQIQQHCFPRKHSNFFPILKTNQLSGYGIHDQIIIKVFTFYIKTVFLLESHSITVNQQFFLQFAGGNKTHKIITHNSLQFYFLKHIIDHPIQKAIVLPQKQQYFTQTLATIFLYSSPLLCYFYCNV